MAKGAGSRPGPCPSPFPCSHLRPLPLLQLLLCRPLLGLFQASRWLPGLRPLLPRPRARIHGCDTGGLTRGPRTHPHGPPMSMTPPDERGSQGVPQWHPHRGLPSNPSWAPEVTPKCILSLTGDSQPHPEPPRRHPHNPSLNLSGAVTAPATP